MKVPACSCFPQGLGEGSFLLLIGSGGQKPLDSVHPNICLYRPMPLYCLHVSPLSLIRTPVIGLGPNPQKHLEILLK